MMLEDLCASISSQMSHSQFQQFSPQLILSAVLVARPAGLISHRALQGVLPGLINKRLDKVRKIDTTTTEHEHIILFLLLCFRYRQFSHLVKDRRQGHSQTRCLATTKGHQHWEVECERNEMTGNFLSLLWCKFRGVLFTFLKRAQQQTEALCYGDRVILLQLLQQANQQLFGTACLESQKCISCPLAVGSFIYNAVNSNTCSKWLKMAKHWDRFLSSFFRRTWISGGSRFQPIHLTMSYREKQRLYPVHFWKHLCAESQ